MTLESAIEGELPFLREEAEARMLDHFDIKLEVPGGPAYNPDLKRTDTVFTLLFSTKGRVKAPGGLAAHQDQVGGRGSISVVRELHIPVGSPAVPANAVAFVTSLGATSDPTLEGAMLRLAGPAPGSQTTARRLEVSEVLT